MEEEFDPILERRAREAKASQTNRLKILVATLAVVAVALGGVLFYVWNKYNGADAKAEKNATKTELLETRTQLDDMIAQANGLTIDNEYLTSQLDTARLQVDALLERLEQTEASNRAQVASYKKELATLRTIMRGYVTQLDSLNTLNQKLIAENKATREELRVSKAKNEDLTRQIEALSEQVSVGEKLKARGFEAYTEKSGGKRSDKHGSVERVVASLTLAENDLAPKGDVTIFVRVLDPEDILLTNDRSIPFEHNGTPSIASASRTVEYAGSDLSVTIYLNDIPEFIKGIYKVEFYTVAGLLGTTSFNLR